MRPDLIIEGHVAGHPVLGVADSLIGMEIDLLIFETSPQPLDEDIVPPPPGGFGEARLPLITLSEFPEPPLFFIGMIEGLSSLSIQRCSIIGGNKLVDWQECPNEFPTTSDGWQYGTLNGQGCRVPWR